MITRIRSYEKSATLVTTNRPFSEWGEVFPKSATENQKIWRKTLSSKT